MAGKFLALHMFMACPPVFKNDFSSDLTFLDYPWNELGKATVVDVGGGVGTSHPKPLLISHALSLVLGKVLGLVLY